MSHATLLTGLERRRRWRRQAQEAMSGFVPAQIIDEAVIGGTDAGAPGCIKVVPPSGAYVEVPFDTPPGIIGAVLGSLR